MDEKAKSKEDELSSDTYRNSKIRKWKNGRIIKHTKSSNHLSLLLEDKDDLQFDNIINKRSNSMNQKKKKFQKELLIEDKNNLSLNEPFIKEHKENINTNKKDNNDDKIYLDEKNYNCSSPKSSKIPQEFIDVKSNRRINSDIISFIDENKNMNSMNSLNDMNNINKSGNLKQKMEKKFIPKTNFKKKSNSIFQVSFHSNTKNYSKKDNSLETSQSLHRFKNYFPIQNIKYNLPKNKSSKINKVDSKQKEKEKLSTKRKISFTAFELGKNKNNNNKKRVIKEKNVEKNNKKNELIKAITNNQNELTKIKQEINKDKNNISKINYETNKNKNEIIKENNIINNSKNITEKGLIEKISSIVIKDLNNFEGKEGDGNENMYKNDKNYLIKPKSNIINEDINTFNKCNNTEENKGIFFNENYYLVEDFKSNLSHPRVFNISKEVDYDTNKKKEEIGINECFIGNSNYKLSIEFTHEKCSILKQDKENDENEGNNEKIENNKDIMSSELNYNAESSIKNVFIEKEKDTKFEDYNNVIKNKLLIENDKTFDEDEFLFFKEDNSDFNDIENNINNKSQNNESFQIDIQKNDDDINKEVKNEKIEKNEDIKENENKHFNFENSKNEEEVPNYLNISEVDYNNDINYKVNDSNKNCIINNDNKEIEENYLSEHQNNITKNDNNKNDEKIEENEMNEKSNRSIFSNEQLKKNDEEKINLNLSIISNSDDNSQRNNNNCYSLDEENIEEEKKYNNPNNNSSHKKNNIILNFDDDKSNLSNKENSIDKISFDNFKNENKVYKKLKSFIKIPINVSNNSKNKRIKSQRSLPDLRKNCPNINNKGEKILLDNDKNNKSKEIAKGKYKLDDENNSNVSKNISQNLNKDNEKEKVKDEILEICNILTTINNNINENEEINKENNSNSDNKNINANKINDTNKTNQDNTNHLENKLEENIENNINDDNNDKKNKQNDNDNNKEKNGNNKNNNNKENNLKNNEVDDKKKNSNDKGNINKKILKRKKNLSFNINDSVKKSNLIENFLDNVLSGKDINQEDKGSKNNEKNNKLSKANKDENIIDNKGNININHNCQRENNNSNLNIKENILMAQNDKEKKEEIPVDIGKKFNQLNIDKLNEISINFNQSECNNKNAGKELDFKPMENSKFSLISMVKSGGDGAIKSLEQKNTDRPFCQDEVKTYENKINNDINNINYIAFNERFFIKNNNKKEKIYQLCQNQINFDLLSKEKERFKPKEESIKKIEKEKGLEIENGQIEILNKEKKGNSNINKNAIKNNKVTPDNHKEELKKDNDIKYNIIADSKKMEEKKLYINNKNKEKKPEKEVNDKAQNTEKNEEIKYKDTLEYLNELSNQNNDSRKKRKKHKKRKNTKSTVNTVKKELKKIEIIENTKPKEKNNKKKTKHQNMSKIKIKNEDNFNDKKLQKNCSNINTITNNNNENLENSNIDILDNSNKINSKRKKKRVNSTLGIGQESHFNLNQSIQNVGDNYNISHKEVVTDNNPLINFSHQSINDIIIKKKLKAFQQNEQGEKIIKDYKIRTSKVKIKKFVHREENMIFIKPKFNYNKEYILTQKENEASPFINIKRNISEIKIKDSNNSNKKKFEKLSKIISDLSVNQKISDNSNSNDNNDLPLEMNYHNNLTSSLINNYFKYSLRNKKNKDEKNSNIKSSYFIKNNNNSIDNKVYEMTSDSLNNEVIIPVQKSGKNTKMNKFIKTNKEEENKRNNQSLILLKKKIDKNGNRDNNNSKENQSKKNTLNKQKKEIKKDQTKKKIKDKIINSTDKDKIEDKDNELSIEKLDFYKGPIDIDFISLKNFKDSVRHIKKKIKNEGYEIKHQNENRVFICSNDKKSFIVEIVKIKNNLLYYLINKCEK